MRALTPEMPHVKTVTTALVAIIALGSFSIACGPSESKGEDIDTGSALSTLRSPTGSFSKDTASSAFAGYRTQRADSSKVSTPIPNGGSSSTSSIRSIRHLDRAASSGSCAQGQPCACPSGGSMAYTASSSAEGQLVKVKFDACGFEDGIGFDGNAILLASTKSLLGVAQAAPAKTGTSAPPSSDDGTGEGGGLKEAQPAPGGATSSQYVALLLAAKGTVSQGAQKLPLAFALLTEGHYAFLAVSVPDGNIVIGVSDDGNAIVRSKEGTWNCKNASRGWACTSEKGESVDVADDGATAGGDSSSPTPPESDPGSDSDF
jgi:hypothetical protein